MIAPIILAKKKNRRQRSQKKGLADPRLNVVATLVFLLLTGAGIATTIATQNPAGVFLGLAAGFLMSVSPKIA